MFEHLKRLLTGEEGQGMAEYGLILALVAVVVIGTLALLGQGVEKNFNKVAEKLNSSE